MGVLDDYYYNTQNLGSVEDQSDWFIPDYQYTPGYETYEQSYAPSYAPSYEQSYAPSYEYQPTIFSPSTPPEQSYISPGESYTDSGPSFWDKLNTVGTYLQSPGGQLLTGGVGALISGIGAIQQNAQNKKAQKEYQKQLAARQARALQYDSPLRLTMDRTRVMGPVTAKGGEASFFTNNKIPSYFAEGGAVSAEPGVLGFLKYLLAGKKLPYDIQQEKEARNRPVGIRESLEAYGNPESRLERQMREQGLACGGTPHYVQGGDSGQSDTVPARLSDGEYVMDADVVSALGDGNNEAGAAKLDEMREAIRAHKRSASPNKIPPKAKSPLAYLKEKKHG